jgi:hypothetical protein
MSEEVLMPARSELTMRQLRQMLRLHHDGVSAREIGRTLGVARSTIQDNLHNNHQIDARPLEFAGQYRPIRLLAPTPTRPDAAAIFIGSSSGGSPCRRM